jgi:membrane protein
MCLVRSNPRADDFQRRHRWAGLPLAVLYKFVDDQGAYLTALITYYAFLSLFPLLLVAATVLGFFLQGDPALQQSILNSALKQFPIVGQKLQTDAAHYQGSGTGLAVGLLVALYGGMGIAQATQNAMNQAYAVPRNERPNPVKARLRSLGLLLTLGLGVLLVTGVSAFSSVLRGWLQYGTYVLSTAAYLLVLVIAFRVLTARPVSVREVLPGAVTTAVSWQMIQVLGAYYVQHQLNGANQVYGVFATVLGLIGLIYLQALVLVLAVEMNVVLRRHLYPRSLLTPFTDAVNLTAADERAYTSYAQAQRHKGFETVDVDFDEEHRADGERTVEQEPR